MATASEIKSGVLDYFHRNWPSANETTKLRDDLLLNDDQIVDIGTELAEQLGCNPTRTQIENCKMIGDMISLLIATRSGSATKGAAQAKSAPAAKASLAKRSRAKPRATSARSKRAR